MMFIIDDILKGIGKRKQAQEQNRANQANLAARKAQWGAGEKRRGVKLDAIQAFLSGLKGAGTLGAGAPDYSFGAEQLAGMKEALPYAEAAVPDVSKGSGWQMAGDIFTGVGTGLANAYMGGLFGGGGAAGAGSAGMAPGGQYTPFNTGLERQFKAPRLT
jgi:hypothetical protein